MSAPGKVLSDPDWGCEYWEVSNLAEGSLRVCQVSVGNVEALATSIVSAVVDKSWMADLDSLTRKGYEAAVSLTTPLLVSLISSVATSGSLTEEFGEIMVSTGSSRALSTIYGHVALPISELWKPKKRNNEGFDFHTVCPMELVNFGEAKYSGSSSPHGVAIAQISRFLKSKKHLMDVHYLGTLCSPASMGRLDLDEYGVVAAFSLNGIDHGVILGNAASAAKKLATSHKVEQVLLVGVAYDAK
jgi:hypothetical protein